MPYSDERHQECENGEIVTNFERPKFPSLSTVLASQEDACSVELDFRLATVAADL